MANMRMRKVENKKQMENLVDEYVTMGYKIKSMGENTTKVEKVNNGSAIGHIVIFLLFGWWTLLLANLLYLIFARTGNDEVVVKVEPTN